jgi:hypothetical protein
VSYHKKLGDEITFIPGFAWVTCGWEMSLVEARKIYGYGGRNGMDGLHLWLTEIRSRWPDAKLITQEFGELCRAHVKNTKNSTINFSTAVAASAPRRRILKFGRITNHPELSGFVREPAREGWNYGKDL